MSAHNVVSLTVCPSAWANLSFEVGGIVEESNVVLGQSIMTPFDYTSFYATLGAASEANAPANLLNSSDIDKNVGASELMALRAEGIKAMLDKACALRAN